MQLQVFPKNPQSRCDLYHQHRWQRNPQKLSPITDRTGGELRCITGLVLEATWLVNPLEEALTAGGAPSGHSLGYK